MASQEIERFNRDMVRTTFMVSDLPTSAEKKTRIPLGSGRKSSKVNSTQPHPDVWSLALVHAAGDAQRIEVVSEREVVVHNNRQWRNGS